MLFVPADSERKLAKGLGSDADAIIIDLEDSVAALRKGVAREAAAAFLNAHQTAAAPRFFVRINPLDSDLALTDLAAVVGAGLAGIVLPKADTASDVTRLAHFLDALEVRAGLTRGTLSIVSVATETAAAMLSMSSYVAKPPRLEALTWGEEDLSTAVGAISNREPDGSASPLYALANTLCLCAAAAAGVKAIDTLHVDFRDSKGLAASCNIARRRGFVGKIAIHPDQVPVINEAFSIPDAERAEAQAVVDAFAAQPGAGTISIDGVMYDLPHLKRARRALDLDR
jgi:citrate lyase subunit beta/citryl-CoA lyase